AHPGDLVLQALGEVLAGWLDEPALRVDILRHGREEAVAGTHLARTTGWFTTTMPVPLDLSPGTAAERLARTVGHLAARPGAGAGASRPPCAPARPATSRTTSRATTRTPCRWAACCRTWRPSQSATSPPRTGRGPISSR